MKKVGIDIGGTQLRAAVFDENGAILEVRKFPNSPERTPQEACAALVEFINCASEVYHFNSLGIGCPGPLNLRLGRVLNTPNLPTWWDFDIVKYFEDSTGIKTVLNNDANVAGLAEAVDGAGRGYDSVFFITMSTGVGGGYIVNQKIVEGANSTAAEIGHMPVCEDPYRRNDGANAGSTNETCSGSAIARQATELLGRPVTTKEVFALAEDGDPAMRELLDTVVARMARAIAIISCVVDPEIFVIGGSVALHNPWLIDLIYEAALPLVFNPQFLRIRLAKFGDDAGLVGASLL